jgi:hypothetical protein
MAAVASVVYIFALGSVILDSSDGVVYTRNVRDLAQIPVDIGSDATVIYLGGNKLTAIRQSDFNNKFPNLAEIVFRFNLIATINKGCFQGTVLIELSLNDNLLTEFPDLSEVAGTLKLRYLQNNRIENVFADDVRGLIKLKMLTLFGKPLLHVTDQFLQLPDFTRLNLTNAVIACCNASAWLKGMGTRASTVGVICSHTTSLAGKSWSAVSEDLLRVVPCGEFENM